MDCQLSRRQMLRFLTLVLPAALFGYRVLDYFDEELVCVHVYGLSQELPAALLQSYAASENRPQDRPYFQIGLPELIVCRSENRLLDMFAYYWPVTRPEIQRFQKSSTILYSLPLIEQVNHFAGLQTALDQASQRPKTPKGSLAVILTFNDYTRHACRRLVEIGCQKGVAELVIFKDPSRSPYLCSYPSQQKGFKKKPPIGSGLCTGRLA